MSDAARYKALAARDSRFDGLFFVGVRTTGIYCRPICPARTPARPRCAFFASSAEAEAAGYRACLRCRPELAPGSSPVDAIDVLVAAATQRIAEGALNESALDNLAAELGVTARHLRRALGAKLGVSPVELAQSRRVALAKQLLHDTTLSVTQIAFAAGFGSIRRFNSAFSHRMGCAPSMLRRPRTPEGRTSAVRRSARQVSQSRALPEGMADDRPDSMVELRLDYRPPYDWPRLLTFLRGRAVPGVEHVADDLYRRIVHQSGCTGEIAVRPVPGCSALGLSVSSGLLPVLMPLVARVRRMFDLDARPDVIARALGSDRRLAASVAVRPGLRLPGAIDPFEAAIRALLGQQVSVAAATTLAGRFAARFGARVGSGALSYRFAMVDEVVATGPGQIVRIGMPMTRAIAIHELAKAVASGAVSLDGAPATHGLDDFVARIVTLPGIGPWTAHYLAMRALHLPDAFPAADLGIQKALRRAGARAAEARAEAWRPFRSYAVMHLWTSLSERSSQCCSRT
jgi:AraC family transcriptional regulator of adaptative response / DNA-3-methyladenine glycosylase II